MLARAQVRAAIVVLLSASLSSCVRQSSPESAFDHAWDTLQAGDVSRAEQEAAKGYERFHNRSATWAWRFVMLRASALQQQGHYDAALNLMNSEPALKPQGELAVKRLWLMGLLHSSIRDFSTAESELKQAETLCIDTTFLTCEDVATARGQMEMLQNHYEAAQLFFSRMVEMARQNHDSPAEAVGLLNLSWAADEQEHFDEAIDRADEARNIAVSQGLGDIAQKALGNMGWAYYKLGEHEKAQRMFEDARKKAESFGNIPDQALWLEAIGDIYLDSHNLPAAENSYLEALRLARQLNNRTHLINSQIALAFAYEQAGKLGEAGKNADEVLRMAHADGDNKDAAYAKLVQGRLAAKQQNPGAAETAFREVTSSPDAPIFLKWQAEHSLARLFEAENRPSEAEHEYQAALIMVEGARHDVKKEERRLPFLINATDIYDDYVHFLIGQGRPEQALQVADFSRARTLGEGLGLPSPENTFQPARFNATQIARRAGGTILYYWLGEKQSYLWAITPQKVKLYTLPAASEIDSSVRHYHDALTGGQPSAEDADSDGTWLYKVLISPAHDLLASGGTIRGSDSLVFVVPDGELNRLNFETLLVPGSKPHYWIEDVSISNASSLRMLFVRSATSARKIATGSLLLVGDAIAPNPDYPALPKAATEMGMIQKHFGAAKQHVLAREAATPPAYLSSKPEQFSYIHFVAHGTASRLSPLDSAIVLSQATAEDDSFKLYARDIIRHKLHADLVTISTCYGSGTRAYSGEGLVGLSWAFLGAGAHNVIGALWEVSDVSTPQLMDQLYDELKKGRSPDAALRAAKLSLLHSNSAFRKPFYWAPFQLYTGS